MNNLEKKIGAQPTPTYIKNLLTIDKITQHKDKSKVGKLSFNINPLEPNDIDGIVNILKKLEEYLINEKSKLKNGKKGLEE